MLSMRRADAVNTPSAKTPTATQSALNASGKAIFVLNSIGLAVLFFAVGKRTNSVEAAQYSGRAGR
jgi:hypothetical protein